MTRPLNKILLFPIIFSIFFVSACQEKSPMFSILPASKTGIDFRNNISENDSNNILDYEYLYNGNGIAVADFNQDGLEDLYFTSSMESNKLYINKGDLQFSDVTVQSNTTGERKWSTGASIVDINNDTWPDIYVCTSRYNSPERRSNLLYVNQGLNENKIPVFKEMAGEYGLADTSFSTQAAFFDYDNDGDLDMYLLVAGKMQTGYQPNTYQSKVVDGTSVTNDRLYRNDENDSLHHPVFTDVTIKANILIEGFGLGVNIADINNDGWKDVYVSNDYLSNDHLWINNRNGTFTDKADRFFKHTSYSAMGNDVQDINNDGLPDVIALDMLAKTNYRKKMMSPPGNYFAYSNNTYFDYDFQYVRNTLQLNQGRVPSTPSSPDTASDPVFSEISFLSGIAETDWSWSPLVADFDNDGYRDLIVSNGLPKDLSDQDFLHFRGTSSSVASKSMIIEEMPEVKITDFAFHNNGDLTFTDVSKAWGLIQPSFSNGAVYADLDNDGDLDCVTNNINGECTFYRNNLNHQNTLPQSWIQLELKGMAKNTMAYGATVQLWYDSVKTQITELAPCRGYLSSVGTRLHFGLDHAKLIDSVRIIWPDHRVTTLYKVNSNQLLRVDIKSSTGKWDFSTGSYTNPYFREVSNPAVFNFKHQEEDYIDFNEYRLLPHKFSQYGPGLAVADIDLNGTDDVFIGGSKGNFGTLLLQDSKGSFLQRELNGNDNHNTGNNNRLNADINKKNDNDKNRIGNNSNTSVAHNGKVQEDEGVLLADFDNDGDPDLYIVSGSIESTTLEDGYSDRIYSNDGKGRFSLKTNAFTSLPTTLSNVSGSAVKGCDFDADGDIDLLRTGRIIPGRYPVPAPTILLRNDSEQGQIKFTDITNTSAPMLLKAGLVADAIWTDFDNDNRPDIILCGEWMAPLILKNTPGGFIDVTSGTGLAKEVGWWNSIAGGDFDNDGDTDYILGNNGTNTLYKASVTEPVSVYAKDFNQDGVFDAVTTLYLPDSTGEKHEFPAFGREEMIRQIIQLRRKFPTFKSFAAASINEVFSSAELDGALIYRAVNLSTSYVENVGGGRFKISGLPLNAQFAPVFGIVVKDVDHDGNLDIILNGNDYGIELTVGRCAALNGLVLTGNGKGSFFQLTMQQSGIYIPGNGKALVTLQGPGMIYMIASQNHDKAKLFEEVNSPRIIRCSPDDRYAMVHLKNGNIRKEEFYFGNSFLSQSARYIEISKSISHIEIVNAAGKKRIAR